MKVYTAYDVPETTAQHYDKPVTHYYTLQYAPTTVYNAPIYNWYNVLEFITKKNKKSI